MDNKENRTNKNKINKKKNKSLDDNLSDDLKMPNATGDAAGSNAADKNKKKSPKPEGAKKLPQREEPGFSGQNEGSFSPSGKTEGTREEDSIKSGSKDKKPTSKAKLKMPSKINQPAKGRFGGEEASKNDQKEVINTSKSKRPAEDKISSGTAKPSESKTKKPPIKGAASKASAADKVKAIKSTSKTKKSKIKEDKTNIGEPKRKKSKSSTTEDLKDLAASAVMGVAEKIIPDEKTREEITKTTKEILPNKKEIKKTAKKVKDQLSPELDMAKKAINKAVPEDSFNEKSEKIKASAKRIKNRNKEKASEKKLDEISLITEFDVHLFKEGKHFHLYKKLGSHLMDFNGNRGVYFALWAPNAKQVSVIGDFNNWEKQTNPMNPRQDESGIWEVFIPEAKKGSIYKYFIQSTSGYEAEKGDPFAFMWEIPPNTASVVWDLDSTWNDSKWMANRKEKAGKPQPVSVYEMHVGSWKRVPEDGMRSLTYRELAEQLPKYLKETGFTHVEFMPVMEHPFFGSWGYQVTGYFAPSSRFGTPQDFMHLIDALHQAGIGVILDWVPSHFPSDLHGIHYFDGTFLFEHADPQKGFHPDWQSYIFNYGRNEVRAFLISNALFWLDKFHADGLRVDAVASMLYLDYSRKDGEWEPNENGGNENLEAISFLREFNEVVYKEFPDTMTIAEESTAWPMVSKPTYMGGLGFGMKWMMGWMHDTLEYFQKDPIHRKHHQNTITFSTNYAFTENFMLPLSHDEVVYGKQALFNKMPGDRWNKFANLRALYSYMYSHPGTKLLFMGGEFAQEKEWDHDSSLEWHLIKDDAHKQMQETVSVLNKIYTSEPALYEKAFEPAGFEWVDFNDYENSVMSYLRKGNDPDDTILVVCNLTPVPRENYRIGVPKAGDWKEIFNSDDNRFGGSGIRNTNPIRTEGTPTHNKENSVSLTLPPMGVIYLKRE